MKFDIDYAMQKRDDGKEIVVPKKLHFDFEVKDRATFHLTNLFNGNKELGKYLRVFFGKNVLSLFVLSLSFPSRCLD